MKLQVEVKARGKTHSEATARRLVQLVASPHEPVGCVKERLLVAEQIPFRDLELVFAGEVLGDQELLCDHHVQDGSCVQCTVSASEESLVQQLSELLQLRAVSAEELALLYCHRYGSTVHQALQFLGCGGSLGDILKRNSCFVQTHGLVSTSRKGINTQSAAVSALGEVLEESATTVQSEGTGQAEGSFPVHVSVVLEAPGTMSNGARLDLMVCAADTVLGLKDFISASELVPFSDRRLFFEGSELLDRQRLVDCGVKEESSLDFVVVASEEAFVQQLSGLLQARVLSLNELSLLYSCRHGATVFRVLELLGQGERFPNLLRRQSCFVVANGRVKLAVEVPRNQRFLDLDGQLSSAAFCQRASRALDQLADKVSRASFLNICTVVKGGSVGRGTAIEGSADARLELFLEGLPPSGRERWLPSLLRSAANALQCCGQDGVEAVAVTSEALQVHLSDGLTVDLLFASACGEAAALTERRVSFVAEQPAAVKAAMRLLKWWRQRLPWSCPRKWPTDDLIELLAIHTALQLAEPPEEHGVVKATLAVMADFAEACLLWPPGSVDCVGEEVPGFDGSTRCCTTT